MMRIFEELVLLAALALAATSCARSDAAQPPAGTAPVPVSVAPVQLATAQQTIAMVGTLGAKEELPLSFKIGGLVSRVSAEAGQAVSAGVVLAELSPTEIAAEVQKAQLARTKAERDLARARSLYRDSVATLEQLQDATTAFEFAEQNLSIAEFNRTYAVVRSPGAGIVLKRLVEPGQFVAPGSPVVLFRSDRRGLVVRGGLSDRDAVALRAGDQATLQFDAFPGEKFSGHVTQIGVAATSGTGTFEIEVAIDSRGRSMASGLVAHVEILPHAARRMPTVPVQAILEASGDSATLFTLSDDRARAVERRVRVGALDGDRVTVLGGLDERAEVVTAGSAWLSNGAPVELIASRPEASAARRLP